MVRISIPVLGESGPDYLAIESVPGFVGGVAVEGVVGDQPVTDRGAEVWGWVACWHSLRTRAGQRGR